jgi:hypothetical protein
MGMGGDLHGEEKTGIDEEYPLKFWLEGGVEEGTEYRHRDSTAPQVSGCTYRHVS